MTTNIDIKIVTDTTKYINIIVATDEKNGIGKNGDIPWKIKEDLQMFKTITTFSAIDKKVNAIIMGRKTWDSLKKKPLPDRLNVVISRKKLPDILSFTSLKLALEHIKLFNIINEIFIIGGSSIYEKALKLKNPLKLHKTIIKGNYDCDTFFPSNDKSFLEEKSIEISKDATYTLLKHEGINSNIDSEETQYKDLLESVIANSDTNFKIDRTLVGTYSKFGAFMRFSLDKFFPLLTTKNVYWKGVVLELLWMIKGSTDSKWLSERKVKIWEDNSSMEFLKKNIKDKKALENYAEGDCGPIYGFQWRHFGAKYINCKTDYKGQGYDQLQACINQIKTNPSSRRILLSAWNPADLDKMCLPPCHVSYQWIVNSEKKELSCMLYMRSNDLGLGFPFNIASASLLTCMISHICSLTPKELVYTSCDAHIYKNHIDALKEQIEKEPYEFPTLRFAKRISDINDFTESDIILENYKCHEKINMKMAQ